jgi:hypothetical protein
MLEQKVIVAVMKTMVKVADHFFLAGQFVGISSGLSSPWRHDLV